MTIDRRSDGPVRMGLEGCVANASGTPFWSLWLGGNAMQAMTDLQRAWERTPRPTTLRPLALPDRPADLYMSALDVRPRVVLVSFSLGRLTALTRAELEVARWAHAGHSNGVIARQRRTSTYTVARQMAAAMRKLGISARWCLATIPELSAFSTPGAGLRAPGGVPAQPLLAVRGLEIEPQEVARIWREIAAGQWTSLAGVDVGGLRHAVMSCEAATAIDWHVLTATHRNVLALMAAGFPQKVIAMKLGLAPSTVSGVLASAHRRLGFASLGQLLRAYCAFRDVID